MRIIASSIYRVIAWVEKRDPNPLCVVRHEDRAHLLNRYQPFWQVEWIGKDGKHYNRPPWWRPFNILLHEWVATNNEEMHDHPRWSVTVVLRGQLIEHTPWGSRTLTPGSIVRSEEHTSELQSLMRISYAV